MFVKETQVRRFFIDFSYLCKKINNNDYGKGI